MPEEMFGASERKACRAMGQPRSTQRLDCPLPSDDEQELRRWLVAFAKEHPRWGWKGPSAPAPRGTPHKQEADPTPLA